MKEPDPSTPAGVLLYEEDPAILAATASMLLHEVINPASFNNLPSLVRRNTRLAYDLIEKSLAMRRKRKKRENLDDVFDIAVPRRR